MSIIHMDGFDSYANTADLAMEYGVSGCNVRTTGGRFGGGAIENNGYSNWVVRNLATPINEVWTGCAIQFYTGRGGSLFMFVSASGYEGGIGWGADNNILTAFRGDYAGSVLGSYSFAPGPTAWHWVEVHYKLHSSAGIIEVWIDGVQVINATGVNTAGSGGSVISSVVLGSTHAGNGPDVFCDDWYILDPNTSPNTTRLGDSRIKTLVPASDAGPNNGTPDTGSTHYTQVNEAQWSSAHSLTLANTSGQEELFGMGALGATPPTVLAVRVLAVVQKSDAGACSIETVVVSGSSEADGASQPVLTTYGHNFDIFEVDPATSAAWAYAAINAMKCGVKIP